MQMWWQEECSWVSSVVGSGGVRKALKWDAAAPAPGALLGKPLARGAGGTGKGAEWVGGLLCGFD